MNRCNFGRFDSNLFLCTKLQQKGSGGTVAHILKHGTWLNWLESFRLQLLYPQGKPSQCPLNTGWLGPTARLDTSKTKKISSITMGSMNKLASVTIWCTESSVLLFNCKISYYLQDIQTVPLVICKHNFLHAVLLYSY